MAFEIKHLAELEPYLCAEIPEVMPARYVQIVIVRQLESHAVFTTEGDDLTTRRVRAGRANSEIVPRLMMPNRKVMATERRLGKETLRALGIFAETADTCYIGRQCGKCIDCILCGFAALKGLGNMNSRVLTDEAWSLAARSGFNTDNVTFNAINERTRGTGQALGDVDMILPGTLFINVTSLKGATCNELLYWLYCSHYTRRYGADASRIGKVRNHIVGLVGSNVEALSSLDLTQRFYDAARDANDPEPLKQKADQVVAAALTSVGLRNGNGCVHLGTTQTGELLESFLKCCGEGNALRDWLTQANEEAKAYAEKKSTRVKGEESTDEATDEADLDESEQGDDDADQ